VILRREWLLTAGTVARLDVWTAWLCPLHHPGEFAAGWISPAPSRSLRSDVSRLRVGGRGSRRGREPIISAAAAPQTRGTYNNILILTMPLFRGTKRFWRGSLRHSRTWVRAAAGLLARDRRPLVRGPLQRIQSIGPLASPESVTLRRTPCRTLTRSLMRPV
jgi:hypothetical protein